MKVWFITGCSTGFGRELAKHVLEAGHQVGVAARNLEDVKDILDAYPENALGIKLDVTDHAQVRNAVKTLHEKFGRIDVLVNNAGIGYFAAIEESEEDEYRKMFEVNFFGLVAVTQEVLPIMRAQHSGHVVNIASIGGYVSFPGVGFYNATKYAVSGYSEALFKETSNLGIKVTVIAPSGFRTDWAGRSANDTKKRIDDYKETAHKNMEAIRGYSGKQPGDPARAAAAILKAVESEHPPLHLLLGKAALKGARNKISELERDFNAWEETSAGADFPA